MVFKDFFTFREFLVEKSHSKSSDTDNQFSQSAGDPKRSLRAEVCHFGEDSFKDSCDLTVKFKNRLRKTFSFHGRMRITELGHGFGNIAAPNSHRPDPMGSPIQGDPASAAFFVKPPGFIKLISWKQIITVKNITAGVLTE